MKDTHAMTATHATPDTIDVPAHYWTEYVDRRHPRDADVLATRFATVRLVATPGVLDDLAADALEHANPARPDADPDHVADARATLRAIDRHRNGADHLTPAMAEALRVLEARKKYGARISNATSISRGTIAAGTFRALVARRLARRDPLFHVAYATPAGAQALAIAGWDA